MKKLSLLLAATALMATPAIASDTSSGGTVAASCSITNLDSAIAFPTMGTYGEAIATDTDVAIFCNAPSVVTFVSANGYLALDADPSVLPTSESDLESPANPGFAAGVDYVFQFMGQQIGWTTKQIDAGVGFNIPAAAKNASGVTFQVQTSPTALPVLAGNYSDDLTITMTPISY